MEITGRNSRLNLNAYIRNTTAKKKADGETDVSGITIAKNDSVEISGPARTLQKANEAIQEIPEVREALIAEVRSQLEKGTYTINRDHIASKMVLESLLNDAE